MENMISKIFISGYSVKGPLHIKAGLPNQDSYLIKEIAGGIVAVAADGIGSHRHSDKGSKAACEAVFEAVRCWNAYPEAGLEILLKLIQNIWSLKISKYEKSECGTTCIFAVYLSAGRIIFGQIGDGIIACRNNGGFFIFNEKSDDFSNETMSLHCASKLSDWSIKEFKLDKKEELSFMIATDGISEDLIPERREDFLNTMLETLKKEPDKRRRKNLIRRILKNWRAKYHTDDKTIILFKKDGADE